MTREERPSQLFLPRSVLRAAECHGWKSCAHVQTRIRHSSQRNRVFPCTCQPSFPSPVAVHPLQFHQNARRQEPREQGGGAEVRLEMLRCAGRADCGAGARRPPPPCPACLNRSLLPATGPASPQPGGSRRRRSSAPASQTRRGAPSAPLPCPPPPRRCAGC